METPRIKPKNPQGCGKEWYSYGGRYFCQHSLFLPPAHLFLISFSIFSDNKRNPLFLPRFRIFAYFFHPRGEGDYWPKYCILTWGGLRSSFSVSWERGWRDFRSRGRILGRGVKMWMRESRVSRNVRVGRPLAVCVSPSKGSMFVSLSVPVFTSCSGSIITMSKTKKYDIFLLPDEIPKYSHRNPNPVRPQMELLTARKKRFFYFWKGDILCCR